MNESQPPSPAPRPPFGFVSCRCPDAVGNGGGAPSAERCADPRAVRDEAAAAAEVTAAVGSGAGSACTEFPLRSNCR